MKNYIFFFTIIIFCFIPKNLKAKNKIDTTISIKTIKKVDSAFQLLVRYWKESTVFPKQIREDMLNEFKSIHLEKLKIKSDSTAILTSEKKWEIGQLPVYVNFGPDDKFCGRILIQKYNNKRMIVFIKSKLIKEESIVVIASVLWHELQHVFFVLDNKYQTPEENNQNEFNAYFNQILFLTFIYGGTRNEECYYRGDKKNFSMKIPKSDCKSFYFYVEIGKDFKDKFKTKL